MCTSSGRNCDRDSTRPLQFSNHAAVRTSSTGRVNFIASCSDRKTDKASRTLMVRNLTGDLETRASIWIRTLDEDDCSRRIPARHLYMGEHWKCASEVADATGVTPYVASAGYGLIGFDDHIKPYAATFAPGHADSVARDPGRTSDEAAEWWSRLSTRPRAEGVPGNISELAKADPSSPLIVAIGGSYAGAIERDLLDAAAHLNDSRNLFLVSTGYTRRALEPFQLPVDARMQQVLGGTLMALNVRIAAELIRSDSEHGWDPEAARRHLQSLCDAQPPFPVFRREPTSDAAIVAFIERALDHDPSLTRSVLLRAFRDSGMACEQKRFGRLFVNAKERHSA